MTETGCRIAAVTMTRDEPVFLPIWAGHWRRVLPSDQVFIVMDGLDQRVPDDLADCQVIRLPRRPLGPGWDESRWRMLSALAAGLLERFDVVVLNDVDEIIILDPAAGGDLVAALAEARALGVISPFAIEVVHRTDLEPMPIDVMRPILSQRRYGRIHASYCKPCIIARPVRWSIGGHYADYPTLTLSRSLFLLHLRAMDAGLLRDRQMARRALVSDAEGTVVKGVAGDGWSRGVEEVDRFLQSFTKTAPEQTDFTFPWQRKRIEQSWHYDETYGIWRHNRLHNRRSYVIPDRFAGLV